jgi:pullulanase
MPFFLAGEEMLRSKDGDENSYASSDAVNNIDWEALQADTPVWEMKEFYRELIALRKENVFLTRAEDVHGELLDDMRIVLSYRFQGRIVAYAVLNPLDEDTSYPLPEGAWTLLLSGDAVYPAGGETLSGSITVPAKGVLLVRR